MDALGGKFDDAVACQGLSGLIKNHHVTGPCFRPVEAKRQDKVLVFLTRHTGGEMVVDAFLKAIHDSHSQGGCQMDFDFLDRIQRACGVKGAGRHE
jgi:hypothetical protein